MKLSIFAFPFALAAAGPAHTDEVDPRQVIFSCNGLATGYYCGSPNADGKITKIVECVNNQQIFISDCAADGVVRGDNYGQGIYFSRGT
ncbi:hypothetical protein F5Y16DRAFT_405376 [Xylariaceae sp. FL0255]|nr:hypothetical protein F5Y16DRAFT_405376 [Xylariaceae sp. FL0255]